MDSGVIYRPGELKERISAPSRKKKVLVIAGPTATGKTQLSVAIARALGGEIISCDSMQIYRGTDIGTAKATREEQKEIPHHLLDICDIENLFNVVNFYNKAMSSLQEILSHDKVPIVVGGAGFYVHCFLYGPPKGPPSDPELRARLEEDLEKFGPEMMYEKVRQFDPDYAASITVQDRHKILRALEIISITGKKVTEIPKPSQEDLSRELDFRCWFIYYPKELLYKRIENRCDEMIARGLLDEVIKLRQQGLENNPSAEKSIGYRQCLQYLDSPRTEADWQRFLTSFKRASKHYAKRQFTWFRKEPLFRWLDLSQITPERALELIIQDFEQN